MNILVFIFLLNSQGEIVGGNAIGVTPNEQLCDAAAAAWFVKAGPAPSGLRRKYLCVRAAESHE